LFNFPKEAVAMKVWKIRK